MNLHSILQPEVVIAALLILLPFLIAAFCPERACAGIQALPRLARIAAPSLFCVPYVLVAHAFHIFRWEWLALYGLLPVGVTFLLDQAHSADTSHRGNWRDFVVLAALGLAVDLRWFEPAWPHGYSAFGKMLLLDAGIYAFLGVRKLAGVGFDVRLKTADILIGLREFGFYAVIASRRGSGWASSIFTRNGLSHCVQSAHLFSRFSSSRFRRSFSFGDGCKICWNGASGALLRSF